MVDRRKSPGTKMERKKRAEKTFTLHWGSGIIEEEVQIPTPYHVPTIVLSSLLLDRRRGGRRGTENERE